MAVWRNIGESFYRIKALALQQSGRAAEGRRTLAKGLREFPESEYLSQIVGRFLPSG